MKIAYFQEHTQVSLYFIDDILLLAIFLIWF